MTDTTTNNQTRTNTIRDLTSVGLVMVALLVIPLEIAHAMPQSPVVQYIWNAFIGITDFDRQLVGRFLELVLNGAAVASPALLIAASMFLWKKFRFEFLLLPFFTYGFYLMSSGYQFVATQAAIAAADGLTPDTLIVTFYLVVTLLGGFVTSITLLVAANEIGFGGEDA